MARFKSIGKPGPLVIDFLDNWVRAGITISVDDTWSVVEVVNNVGRRLNCG